MTEAPERIWIDLDDNPYFYVDTELQDAAEPVIEYIRSDLYEAVKAERDALKADRDELLAALADVLPYAEAAIGPTWRANPPSDSVIIRARSLIERIKGKEGV